MDLLNLARQLDAIDWAAQRLGYNVREVKERTEKIRVQLTITPHAPTLRQHVINIRGYDMPPQFATTMWLDLQLERLIDMLSSPEDRADEAELAARFRNGR